MTVIKQDDVIASVADALQFISYYHPVDFIRAMRGAWEAEESPAAKGALTQVLVNSRMCAVGKRPICQDTGIVIVFVTVGMDVQWQADMSLEDMINEGVRRGYTNPDNLLRGSVLIEPDGARANTKDNTPAVIHTRIVSGDKVEFEVAAKGGGSEAKAKFAMLNPADSVVDWVLSVVPSMGAGWCPPGVLGVGVGGTPEKAMLLAKESLMEPLDMHELQSRGASTHLEEMRIELFEKVNALGIGAQGLGGLTTVLDVKVKDYPTHAANKPVAVIPNCSATRHVHFTLDGSGPAEFTPPDLAEWPDIKFEMGDEVKRVNLDTLAAEDVQSFRAGDTLLLSGKMLTGRDAAHKKLVDMINAGEELPVDFTNRFIYYVGPVDPVRDEVVGPAGPTTGTRMDKFTRPMLESAGLIGMIGKAERGPEAIAAIKDNKAVSMIAVGGAAYLVAKAITKSTLLAFPELGMEAIYEFEVKNMPVTVAVDSTGRSVHIEGPKIWSKEIADRILAREVS
ncbi:MAG: fumarate hydratase [Gammaproteobacteria bacterium]|nr:fumarate hydratase [Gammaproteobacteria bacterium]